MSEPHAPASLLYERLEAPLAPLRRLPRGLWLWSLVHSQGRLAPRLAGIERLRESLVAGAAPAGAGWPQAPLAHAVEAAIAAADLPRWCEGRAELTDSVLRSLCFHLDLIVDYVDRGAGEAAAASRALEEFGAEWRDRCAMMDELAEVFGELDDGKNVRWDLLRGTLRSAGWQEAMRIRRMLESLPELAALIRRLGRARATDDPDETTRSDVPVMEETVVVRQVVRTVRVPDFPGETRGIRRSGRVARMLPAEAMLLLHPRLRMVWHARHAERTLLCYEDDDRMPEVVHEAAPSWRPRAERAPGRRLEMGPMIVCVDTSGSMQGGAEAVAKAVVLEAARTAHRSRRDCHLFAFSGPGELVEARLSPDADGVEQLARFMGQSFRGGTDVSGPLERALAKLRGGEWRLADLLIASDGEFGATPEVAADVRRAKDELGLRVQGVLIGDRETIGFLEVADDIHWVREWRRYGGGDAEVPVHSRSLTATYFPGALRTPGNRDATLGAADAARAFARGSRRGDA